MLAVIGTMLLMAILTALVCLIKAAVPPETENPDKSGRQRITSCDKSITEKKRPEAGACPSEEKTTEEETL